MPSSCRQIRDDNSASASTTCCSRETLSPPLQIRPAHSCSCSCTTDTNTTRRRRQSLHFSSAVLLVTTLLSGFQTSGASVSFTAGNPNEQGHGAADQYHIHGSNSNRRQQQQQYPTAPFCKRVLVQKTHDEMATELELLANTTRIEHLALESQHAQEIRDLHWKLTKLETDARADKTRADVILNTTAFKAVEEQKALQQQIAQLVAQLAQLQATVQDETALTVKLQADKQVLHTALQHVKGSFANTVSELEHEYELEQNERMIMVSQHAAVLEQLRLDNAAAVLQAVQKGLDTSVVVRAEVETELRERQTALNLTSLRLATTQDTVRELQGLIAEWSKDRESIRAMMALTFSLTKARVMALARRAKVRIVKWTGQVDVNELFKSRVLFVGRIKERIADWIERLDREELSIRRMGAGVGLLCQRLVTGAASVPQRIARWIERLDRDELVLVKRRVVARAGRFQQRVVYRAERIKLRIERWIERLDR